MPRIQPVTIDNAPEGAKPVLENVKAGFGRVPNIFATVANSPVALKALMGMFGAFEGGALSPLQTEALALRVSQLNGCSYCTAAHTAKAKMAGATKEQTLGFRKGQSDDPKIQTLLLLACTLVSKGGALMDDELAMFRNDGLTDEEILEVLAIVVLNIFTNSINALAQTEVDFPKAPVLA